MSLANFKVFTQYAYSAAMERLTTNIALFNAATRGAIVLTSGSIQGDFRDTAMYSRISGLVRRRDAYGSGSVSEKELAMIQDTAVKVAAGTPPVRIDAHWWQWIQRNPREAGVKLGDQLSEDMLADFLAVAIKSLVAAQVNEGNNIKDGTSGTASVALLNEGARLFGDKSQELLCWVMHSKVAFDIWGAALTNAAQLFQYGTVMVRQDAAGRPFVITDQSDLSYSSSGTKYRTLGLVSNSVYVEGPNDFLANEEVKNGDESIITTWQSQWTFNLGVKGYAWDKTNGGKSPTTAALATGTNWDKYAASTKDLPGVIINSQ